MSGRSVGFLAIVTVVASFGCSSSPTAPERAPAGEGLAYVANFRSDNMSVIDIATNTVTATVAVGDNPVGVAITPEVEP
jgi:YVTN family beta-propeller protein